MGTRAVVYDQTLVTVRSSVVRVVQPGEKETANADRKEQWSPADGGVHNAQQRDRPAARRLRRIKTTTDQKTKPTQCVMHCLYYYYYTTTESQLMFHSIEYAG
uniref:Uncharacterized protein n=1 Tax=Plectus sambesii TaxID=2011161 RepID=A0A914UQT0_9BILA